MDIAPLSVQLAPRHISNVFVEKARHYHSYKLSVEILVLLRQIRRLIVCIQNAPLGSGTLHAAVKFRH